MRLPSAVKIVDNHVNSQVLRVDLNSCGPLVTTSVILEASISDHLFFLANMSYHLSFR